MMSRSDPIRVTRRSYGLAGKKGVGWDAWVMEPGGVWFWIGKAWTKRGAVRVATSFRAWTRSSA